MLKWDQKQNSIDSISAQKFRLSQLSCKDRISSRMFAIHNKFQDKAPHKIELTLYTSVPHQFNLSDAFVQKTAKNMTTAAIAIELSSAALNTKVYLLHQALYFLLMRKPKTNPTMTQLP